MPSGCVLWSAPVVGWLVAFLCVFSYPSMHATSQRRSAGSCRPTERMAALLIPAALAANPRVMAVLRPGSVPGIDEKLTVYEDVSAVDAPIVFQGVTSTFTIKKRSEPQYNTSQSWGGDNVSHVLDDASDLLGNALLGKLSEPSYQEVASLAPPALVGELNCGDFALGDGQTFIGSRIAAEKLGFSATGAMSYGNINQGYHLREDELLINRTRAGLLGGWLPAPFWRWSLPNGDSAEQLAFAPAEGTADRPLDPSSQQPTWVRFLNVSASGELRYAQYVDTYETYPSYCPTASDGFPTQLECDAAGATAFYSSLLSFARYWNATLVSEGAMEAELPDDDAPLAAFARHSLARLMITRRGLHFPRYGAPPLAYGAPMIDGFQDVFCADLAVYLEWGLLSTARGVFDNYLSFYVRSGGVVNYRGPELAQYGRMLTLTAQLHRLTGDDALLLKYAAKLLGISSVLLDRRHAAKALPRSDPSHGLLRGVDESDELFTQWSASSSELPHVSFSLEAWRGFGEIGRVWKHLGALHARPDLIEAGQALLNETAPLLSDIHAAIKASAVPAGGGLICHPYVAGEGACADMNTEGAPPYARVSHTTFPYNARANEPWRSYSGMLYSGGLHHATVAQIVQHNQNRSKLARLGVWSGGPGFDNRLMGFTAQGHGYGLLQHDLIRPFLLLLFSIMAHVCSRGTWTCYESRGLPNWPPKGGYASPSQAVVPLLVKWMLVWEAPPAADEREDGARDSTAAAAASTAPQITLCKATPRSWLQSGRRIQLRRAPTSLGLRVSMDIVSRLDAAEPAVMANVSVEAMPDAVLRAALQGGGEHHNAQLEFTKVWELALRLRVPSEWHMDGVKMDGNTWLDFDAAAEMIRLPAVNSSIPIGRVAITHWVEATFKLAMSK